MNPVKTRKTSAHLGPAEPRTNPWPTAWRAAAVTAALPLAGLCGCIDTDAAVFVEGGISNPTITVTKRPANTTLSGEFTVNLHLGPRASDASEVKLGKFYVTDGSQSTTLVDVLAVQCTPPFPVSVGVDSDVAVAVQFTEQENLLALDAYEQLCASAGLIIAGALDDGLRGGTLQVASTVLAPSGCP